MKKTVYVVDDDEGVRESLRPLIESVGLRVETYASASAFLDDYQADTFGCLLLDVRMPGMSGLELQETLATRGISLPVLVITGYADVPTAVRAMKTGALDFIEKPFNKQDLLEKIQRAIARDQQVKEANEERASILARIESLTPREAEVMGRVVAGQANKVIAIELDISKKTVEAHRARVMEKMGVRAVAQLVKASMIARGYPLKIAAPEPTSAEE
jgi:two-component system response regulator FixJ